MKISRRKFVKLSSLVSLTPMLPFSGFSIMNMGSIEGNITSLYTRFQNPSGAARPFVRWWWNGDRINEKELARELDLLKGKGISGVEINPITSFFEIFRMGLLGEGTANFAMLLYSVFITIVVSFGGLMIFNKQGDKLIDVV